MLPTANTDKLIFESAPLGFLALCGEVFSGSALSIAILPLHKLECLNSATLHTWLDDRELVQLRKFSLEKRSREWLGGRTCAKQSATIFFRNMESQTYVPNYSQCMVQSEESGRPYFSTISGLELNFPELSISHSKTYAAAMSSQEYCGIDIQYSAKTLDRVQEKFCTTDEKHILEDLLPEYSSLSRITQLWSAKEAAKKMLSPGGIPGFHELELLENSKHSNGNSVFSFSIPASKFHVQVATTMFTKDYALAICCATSNNKVHQCPSYPKLK